MRTQLHHLLSEQAAVRPAAPAVTFRDDARTYASLWSEASDLAQGLLELGLCRGDRVGILLDKRPETVVTIFATSAAAGVFVPVNPLLKPDQVGYVLGDCQVKVLVTTRSRWEQVAPEVERLPFLLHVVLVDGAAPSESAVPTRPVVHEYADVRASGSLAASVAEVGRVDLDPAAILYTSGSTGRPKGVVLSHRNLVVGAESVSTYLENTADDVILAALPLSFDAGLSQVTTAFAVGAHVILVNYLLPKTVVELCVKHAVTGMTCVPPLWIQLAAQRWPAEASGLRYFANTGGAMPLGTLQELREIFPVASPYLMYGLTEAFRSTFLDPSEVDRRPGSIGRAIPNAEVLVLRPDGSRCDPGEEGELVHRGPLVALGYWEDAERSAERFRPYPVGAPAWRAPEMAVWSGDTVVSDEEGFLYFVGRTDDMIKTSGYRVSPTEIEQAVYATGLVRDAVAIGVSDPRLGQRIVLLATAVDAAGLDVEQVEQELRRRLPLYMVPSEIRQLSELPRSPNGKFDRVLLREEALA